MLHEMIRQYRRLKKRRIDRGALDGDKSAERREKLLRDRIMAHPDGFEKLRYFMVDVHGYLVVEKHLHAGEFAEALAERGHEVVADHAGELAREVRECIMRASETYPGVLLTDSEAGSDSWLFGAHCTEETSRKLCQILYARFGSEIEKGVIVVERHDWSIEPVQGRIQGLEQ